ncbi:hypothetical protein GCM10023163_12720 [Aestuariibaculum suncheonense]
MSVLNTLLLMVLTINYELNKYYRFNRFILKIFTFKEVKLNHINTSYIVAYKKSIAQ